MQKRNKIIFIAPIYLPGPIGGAETVIRDLAEPIVKAGYTGMVLTSDVLSGRSWYDPFWKSGIDLKRNIVNGVEVQRLACKPYVSAFLFILNKIIKLIPLKIPGLTTLAEKIEILSWGPIWKDMEEAIVKAQPDIVILSPFPAGICLTGKEICVKHHIPYSVIPFFKMDQKAFENRLLGDILDNAYSVFTPTNTEKKYIQRFTKNKNIHLLPSSIDSKSIDPVIKVVNNRADRLKRQNNWTNKKIVLFAGYKGKGKGIFDSAAAVERMNRDDVILVAMGNNPPEWNAYIHRMSQARWLVDIPYKEGIEKYSYFRLCDLLILPSTTDNFPLVFLEAWYFRKPVLAYNFYTMKELVSDGSGFLAVNQDIADLSGRIAYIVDHPKEARFAGKRGYDKVSQFNRETIVQKYFIKGLPADFLKKYV